MTSYTQLLKLHKKEMRYRANVIAGMTVFISMLVALVIVILVV